ncbi:hypothetical protein BKA66DRAFT_438880 [Pyrenochaeta sp. MPI-SDFR-AT-0127]|nr:hypothetical protein BKA66DRAFT_438880 [Pyrenochaeta sp. MPI-SDFR-AT-0127]
MSRQPLKILRVYLKRPSSLVVRPLSTGVASECTMRVNQAIKELKDAKASAEKSVPISKSSLQPAGVRRTTRTEQLVWLAKQSLRVSKVRKNNATQHKSAAEGDHLQTPGYNATPEPTLLRRRSWEVLSTWSHLW